MFICSTEHILKSLLLMRHMLGAVGYIKKNYFPKGASVDRGGGRQIKLNHELCNTIMRRNTAWWVTVGSWSQRTESKSLAS